MININLFLLQVYIIMVSYYKTINEKLARQLYYVSLLKKQSKTIDAMIDRIENKHQSGGADEEMLKKLEAIRDRADTISENLGTLDFASIEAATKLKTINEQIKAEIARFKNVEMDQGSLNEATEKLEKSIREYKAFQDNIMQDFRVNTPDSMTSWVYRSNDTEDFPYSDNSKLLAAYGSVVNDYTKIKAVIQGDQKDIDHIVAVAREQIEPTLIKIKALSAQIDKLMVQVRGGLEKVNDSSSGSMFDITIGSYGNGDTMGYISTDKKTGFAEKYSLDSRGSRVQKFIKTLEKYSPSLLSDAIQKDRDIIGKVKIVNTKDMIATLDGHIKMMNDIAYIPHRGGAYNQKLEEDIISNVGTLSALNSEMEKLSIDIEKYNRALNKLSDVYKEYGTFVVYKLTSMSKMSRDSVGEDVIYKNLTPETIKEYTMRTDRLLADISIGANPRAGHIGRIYSLALKKVMGFLEHISHGIPKGQAVNLDSCSGRIKTDFILFNDMHKLIDGYHEIETVPAIKKREEAIRMKIEAEKAGLRAIEEAREKVKKAAAAAKLADDIRYGRVKVETPDQKKLRERSERLAKKYGNEMYGGSVDVLIDNMFSD
jgi:hypothetical protein